MKASEPVVVPFPPASPAPPGSPAPQGAPWAPWPRALAVLGLVLAGAAAYGLHVRSTALAGLGWGSTLPWLLLATHPRLAGRGNTWAYLGSVYLAWIFAISWLQPYGTVAWLLGCALYAPQVLPAFWITAAARRAWPSLPLTALWPVAFTGTEWLRVHACPGELALGLLGYSQIQLPRVVQIADITGVAGVTFLLAAATGLLGEGLGELARPREARRWRRVGVQGAAVLGLVAAVVAYGTVRDSEETFSDGPVMTVVQPALPHGKDAETAWQIYDLEVLQTLSVAAPGSSDAVLWPENSVMLPIVRREADGTAQLDPHVAADLLPVVRQLGQPLLVDGGSVDADGVTEHHSCVFVRPDGTFDTYDKVLPLPWTEQLPAAGFVSLLGDGALDSWKRFVAAVVGFVPAATPGDPARLRPMHLTARDGKSYSFGTPICFEIGNPSVVNLWHRQGVDFLVNQASEGLLGNSVHAQTIVVSGFRAIEGRVSVVRATNDGISALIDPNGRVREVLRGRRTGKPIDEGGWFTPTVILDSRRGTLYTRFGDWLPVGCLLAGLGLWAAAAWTTRRARARS